MKKYRIRLNGQVYEIEVEEITNSEATETKPKEDKPKPKLVRKKEIAETPNINRVANAKGEEVKAPMPGTILDIKVNENDRVKEGQVLVILEAMKMENEIVAPRDGKVVSINVTKGQAVNAQDPLVSLE
ncbi:biotin/lipoyl-containing protein [Thermohalobacter berrensis]|uniref:Acetyl-CoA carboxylase biotin carboxyl carrier protein subunit n=1 Tax=Thermohalobacter berrensis TaxID=99594 RepID=A0A419SUH8_9FIRM|nr:biotin/lipoyl-containing protein [Thermohalobacter berrensis]RKD28838.1 acetyl-CoA carboxylase biotin carboxyl carrier protein subunit [Thermohalobacter berrensis]